MTVDNACLFWSKPPSPGRTWVTLLSALAVSIQLFSKLCASALATL